MFLLLRGFCWRRLLRCSRWIWSRRSRSREVAVENLPGRGFGASCCACESFAREIVRDSPMVNFVSQTMNKLIKMRLNHRRRSLCCLETQKWSITSLADTKHIFRDLWILEFCSWLRPRAVSRLGVRFARDNIIKSLRSELPYYVWRRANLCNIAERWLLWVVSWWNESGQGAQWCHQTQELCLVIELLNIHKF